jgi:hypothetical protein
VTSTCPTCGAAGVPVLIGLPVDEARRAARDGHLALAGCIVDEDEPPNWECADHHRWVAGTIDEWQGQIIEVLERYGYDDMEQD